VKVIEEYLLVLRSGDGRVAAGFLFRQVFAVEVARMSI
jgi:hypothetical protein